MGAKDAQAVFEMGAAFGEVCKQRDKLRAERDAVLAAVRDFCDIDCDGGRALTTPAHWCDWDGCRLYPYRKGKMPASTSYPYCQAKLPEEQSND